MKKPLLIILCMLAVLAGCKKDENEPVAIDMTLKKYSADAKFGSLPVILKLSFESNSIVKIQAFPSEEVVELKYEVADKQALNTTLKIYGTLDKNLTANGFQAGSEINWTSEIGRLSYNAHIVGFTAGGYHFMSY